MPFNGAGSFSPPAASFPAVSNTLIEAVKFNAIINDIATNGLSNCITKDGQTTLTANIPMGGFRLTGLGVPTTAGDALRRNSPLSTVTSRSSNTVLAGTDCGTSFVATSSFTQTLTAAATLGAGWYVDYRNDGTGVIVFDPNSTETIDGAVTKAIFPGESCRIYCDGSNFKTIGLSTVRVIAKSAVAVATPADTSEDTLVTVTIPANTMRANGALRIRFGYTFNNNANNKTLKVKLGGTAHYAQTLTTQLQVRADLQIANVNAANAQKSGYMILASTAGVSGGFEGTTSAIDTTADTTITFTGQKAVAGDTLQLEQYSIEVLENGV